jgi:hypothetical protein
VKKIEHVRLFLPSPMDLVTERQMVRELVAELNLTAPELFNLWVEVLSWESHSFPSIGPDAQYRINAQIGDDYEIFLGLAWSRIGTPTPRAESGTIEEFSRALDRFKAGNPDIHIMFYFLDSPMALSQVDIDQLERLRSFQKKLRDLGVLYCTLVDSSDLLESLRIHLTRVLRIIARSESGTTDTSVHEQRLCFDRDLNDVLQMCENSPLIWRESGPRLCAT